MKNGLPTPPQVLYELQTLVAQRPTLALPLARLRGHGVAFGPDTEIVIEGFPRSANSFAVAAFARAQGRKPQIAHHVHAPAQVIAATRAGVPAIVLIRNPEDAVLEYVIKKPAIRIGQALRGYARFYEPLLRFRSAFLPGVFDEVTKDFGTVIRRVNERFGTAFREFDHTEENARATLDEIDGYWRGILGPGERLEIIVGRPSAVRDEMKEQLRRDYADDRLARARNRADAVYRKIAAQARTAV
ncbi:MAG: hypothetical protein M3N24_07505 [Actinomycetota bacterium]|nr:hypothetical protein [Actinomycetota bacterium]